MKRSAASLCKSCLSRQASSRRRATTTSVPLTFYNQLLASTVAHEIHPLKTVELVQTAVKHGKAAPELADTTGGVFTSLVRAFVSRCQYESVLRLIEGSEERELVDQLELVAPVAKHYIDALIYGHGQAIMRQRQSREKQRHRSGRPTTPSADLEKAARFVQRLAAQDLLSQVPASVLSRLIQKLYEARATPSAVALVQLGLQHSVSLDVKSWNVLLQHEALQVDSAASRTLAAFDRMVAAGVKPDEQSLSILVNALRSDSEYTAIALAKLHGGREHGVWNKRLATLELTLLKRQRRYDDVLDRFARYFGTDVLATLGYSDIDGPIEGDWAADTFVISLLVDTLVRRQPMAGDLQQLYLAYTRMVDARPEYDADCYTLSIFVAAMARHRELMTQAMELLEHMHRINLRPSVVTYTSVIDGLTLHGALRLASRVLAAMQERTIKPDARTFERLITAHLRRDEKEEAQGWLKAMERLDLQPSKKLLGVVATLARP